MYTTLLTETKKWYDQTYLSNGQSLEELSARAERKTFLDKIYEYDFSIYGKKLDIMAKIQRQREYKTRMKEVIRDLKLLLFKKAIDRDAGVELLNRAKELQSKDFEYDDEGKMEELKALLSAKTQRDYKDLSLEELHHVLIERENEQEKVNEIDNEYLAVNIEYKELFDAIRELQEKSGVYEGPSIEELRKQVRDTRKKLLFSIGVCNAVQEELRGVLSYLGNTRWINDVSDALNKMDDINRRYDITYDGDSEKNK